MRLADSYNNQRRPLEVSVLIELHFYQCKMPFMCSVEGINNAADKLLVLVLFCMLISRKVALGNIDMHHYNP